MSLYQFLFFKLDICFGDSPDACRVSGKECSLSIDDVADLLDEDFDAMNRVLNVFTEQFSSKFSDEKKPKGAVKKLPSKKK